jgi:hypothetical protein
MKDKGACTVGCSNGSKGNSFNPFGCTINDCENIITIITKLLCSHQINVDVGETVLGEGDVERPSLSVALDLDLLTVQAGPGPGHHQAVLNIPK